MRVPVALGMVVPNFIKVVPNFVKDVLRVSKCIPRWELTSNNFLIGFEMI